MISKERLLDFCKKNKIWVPNKSLPMKELQAIVARWVLDNEKIDRKSCFGLVDVEDNNCISCDLKKSCFKLSIGVDEETYWKRVEKADKLKIEFN